MGQKLGTSLVTLLFLGAMFGGLFHMAGMEMSGGMTDCPYMSQQETICAMSVSEHLGAWQSTFTSIAPTLFTILGLLFVAVVVGQIAPNLLQKVGLALKRISSIRSGSRDFNFVARPLQELFSSGILHPKLF